MAQGANIVTNRQNNIQVQDKQYMVQCNIKKQPHLKYVHVPHKTTNHATNT